MTAETRKFLGINAEFKTYGQINARMYWVKTMHRITKTKNEVRKRKFIIPYNTTKLVFGGIFLFGDWETQNKKISAFCHNSIPQNGKTLKEDLYDFTDTAVRPIKFGSLKELETSRYSVGNEVICGVFIGNIGNPLVLRSKNRPAYYKEGKLDRNSFIRMIKDNNEERKDNNGME